MDLTNKLLESVIKSNCVILDTKWTSLERTKSPGDGLRAFLWSAGRRFFPPKVLRGKFIQARCRQQLFVASFLFLVSLVTFRSLII